MTPAQHVAASRKAIDVLSREEIAALTGPSDAMGAWAVVSTWAIIAGALAVVARWPNVFTRWTLTINTACWLRRCVRTRRQ